MSASVVQDFMKELAEIHREEQKALGHCYTRVSAALSDHQLKIVAIHEAEADQKDQRTGPRKPEGSRAQATGAR
jgi:hypothetical protein